MYSAVDLEVLCMCNSPVAPSGRLTYSTVAFEAFEVRSSMLKVGPFCDLLAGLKRGVNRRLPRGQELWDTETMGHNVFQVIDG